MEHSNINLFILVALFNASFRFFWFCLPLSQNSECHAPSTKEAKVSANVLNLQCN